MPGREGSIRVSLTGSKKPFSMVSKDWTRCNEDIQRTGPVKVLLDFVDHVPTILESVTWAAEATLPKARVAVRAYAEGSLMSAVALCVRRVLVVGRRVSRRSRYGLVVCCSHKGKQNDWAENKVEQMAITTTQASRTTTTRLAGPKHGQGEGQRAPARNSSSPRETLCCLHHHYHVECLFNNNNDCCSLYQYSQDCYKDFFVSNVVTHSRPGHRVSTVGQEGCEEETARPPICAAIRSCPTSMSVLRVTATMFPIVKLTCP